MKGSDSLKKNPAILIIHGLGEGIEDNENFFNYIQKTHEFDVYMFTLQGSNRKNKTKKGYHDWLDIAEENIKSLEKEYDDIYIVGHSMGAVISCFLASLHNVKKLVLVAPAFGVFNFKQNIIDIKNKIRHNEEETPDSKVFYDIVFSRILSVPLRSYKNFILFTHKYKNCVRYVKCDSLIIYGLNDEIVPKRVVDGAYELLASNNKVYIEYEKVGHVVFQSKRKDEINKDIYNFLIGGKKWTCKKKRKK